jgi:hypothetical protein
MADTNKNTPSKRGLNTTVGQYRAFITFFENNTRNFEAYIGRNRGTYPSAGTQIRRPEVTQAML